MKGSTLQHQNLVKEFMIEVSRRYENTMILTYTNGMFRAFDNPDRIIRAGVKGAMDLLVMGNGFYLWFDAKTGNAKLTKEQKFFRERLNVINNGREVAHKLPSVEAGLEIVKWHYEAFR